MSTHITIYDNAIPMLDQLALIHHGQALDALDHAGSKIRKATRSSFDTSEGHSWFVKYVNGKKIIFKADQPAVFGQRFNHKNKGGIASPISMGNFITSYLMERSMTMVVSGMHKRFRAKIRRNGEVVGEAAPTEQVYNASYQILKKLNYGGTYQAQDPDYKRLTRPRTMHGFRNAQYRARFFIERGRLAAMGEVQEIMTSKLETLIHKQINRATVQTKVKVS